MTTNTTNDPKLETLLEKGQLDEARDYIKAFFMEPAKPTDKADAAIDYAHVYLKVMDRINRRYLDSLSEVHNLLKTVDSTEKQIGDATRLSKLKSELKIKK